MLRQTLAAALELIHLYRNQPGRITNYARQVDPVIRALRMELEKVAPGWSARMNEETGVDYEVILPGESG